MYLDPMTTRRGRIELAGDPRDVFPLFGPLRERDWADGWRPEPVGPAPEPMAAGFVFRTADPDRGDAVWVLTDWDEPTGRVRYVMVAPRSHVARISIDVRGLGPGRTTADVRYGLTPLAPGGEAYVAALTERRFATWMHEWRAAIDHWLRTGTCLPAERGGDSHAHSA